MNVKRKVLMTALMAAGLASGAAQASIIVEDWDLNLGAVAGQGLVGTVTGIDEITYRGLARSEQQDADASGTISVGDTGQTYGALTATSYTIGGSTTTGFPIGGGLNIGYEMTFTFQVDSVIDDVSLTGQHQTHVAPDQTTGLLNIYIDNLTDGIGTQASVTTGLGYDDGTLVATFQVIPGGGGPFSFVTLDGSDDAQFVLVSAMAGVFTKGGVDLGSLVGELLVMTDSNFDADPDGDGDVTDFPVPTNTGVFAGNCPGGINVGPNSCIWANEDGSAVLAIEAVPEPASLLLFGTGLIGLWGARRRTLKA